MTEQAIRQMCVGESRSGLSTTDHLKRRLRPGDHRMSFTDLALMELHVEALYRRTAEGRLLETREKDPVRAPRFFLGRTRQGNLWRFRDDVPASLMHDL